MKFTAFKSLNRFNKIPFFNYIVIVTAVYFVLVGLQLSTSSIGILRESGDSSSGLILGSPRAVRSDEFLRGTPEYLGNLNFKATATIFDYSSGTESQHKSFSVSSLINSSPDQGIIEVLAKLLPTDSGFSLRWWYSTFLALIAVPLFLTKIGVKAKYAISAAMVSVASPSSQWWSNSPIGFIAAACFGGFLLAHVVDSNPKMFHNKHPWFRIFLAAIGVLVVIQLPLIYPPWSIPIVSVIGSLLIGHIYSQWKIQKINIKTLITVTIAFIISLSLKFYISLDSITSTLSTVYPGERRAAFSGTSLPIFSTNLSSNLASKGGSLISGNQSELSVSLIELGLIGIAVIPVLFFGMNRSKSLYPLIAAYIPFVILFSWLLPIWPEKLLTNNPLTLIPPDRMAQILSMISILIFFMILSIINNERSESSSNLKLVYFATLTPILVLVINDNQRFISFFAPGAITQKEILFKGILLLLILLAITSSKNKIYAIALSGLLFLVSYPVVNPLQRGSGDITHSEIAKTIQGLDSDKADVWAGDSIWIDALLMANAQDILSGQQPTGPNLNAWHKLDPSDKYVTAWNRGASYVTFNWVDSPDIEISNPNPDIIQINIDPCSEALSQMSLDFLITFKELPNSCLVKVDTLLWQDTATNIYKLK